MRKNRAQYSVFHIRPRVLFRKFYFGTDYRFAGQRVEREIVSGEVPFLTLSKSYEVFTI